MFEALLLHSSPTRESKPPVTDVDLHRMKRIAGGDAIALGDLYDAHGAAVYTLALRILRHSDDAEEVVQEVFAQAWRQADRYDPRRATVIGWLLMMARARALDALRARSARPDVSRPAPVPNLPSSAPQADAIVMSKETVDRVRTVLRDLDEPLRTPLELAYFEGLSHSEIADRLNQPLGTVKTRIRNALSQLRDVLLRTEAR
jgi:RNA polymerase sigma-70 factor, ECF subfamily